MLQISSVETTQHLFVILLTHWLPAIRRAFLHLLLDADVWDDHSYAIENNLLRTYTHYIFVRGFFVFLNTQLNEWSDLHETHNNQLL